MEPELDAGNLILIEEISPSEVKEGDIIVFSIPKMVREHYNYPPVIAHRVIILVKTHSRCDPKTSRATPAPSRA